MRCEKRFQSDARQQLLHEVRQRELRLANPGSLCKAHH